MNIDKDLELNNFFFKDDYSINSLQGHESLEYFNSGKQVRSKVIFELSKILNVPFEKAGVMGRVIEIIHNATLTHDDVIDKAVTRRGYETVNSSIGNTKAILLGDYMLAKALVEISELESSPLVHSLSLALKKLVDGEWLQFENKDPYQFDLKKYCQLAELKTGALFEWAFASPYIFLDQSRSERSIKAGNIGTLLGIIFQVQDDILDFQEQTGKKRFQDYLNDNPNIVFSLSSQDIKPEYKSIKLESFSVDIFKARTYLESLIQKLKSEVDSFIETQDQKIELKLFFQALMKKLIKRSF